MLSDEKRRAEGSEAFEKKLKKTLRVDPRYSVLDFRLSTKFLHILTDSLENAKIISRVYAKVFPDAKNSDRSDSLPDKSIKIKIVLLPDKSVANLKKGICHVGVAPVRSSPASSSEQVTQVLYGESFDALQVVGDWVRVRLHADGYVGWASSDQVELLTEVEFAEYQLHDKTLVLNKTLPLFEKPSEHSSVLREAVFGSQLAIKKHHGDYLEVKMPDGVSAYAKKSGVTLVSSFENSSIGNLIATARTFQGISYAWGGRSVKGFDCSGFVQTVFRSIGVDLPRDTDLQFSAGKFVGKHFRRMRPGDLLFFSPNGYKISHVAIYLGRNKEFIHSSGFVRINSLDPRRKNFSKKLFSRFVGACRVIH
jgi:hypothetical protein